MSTGRLTGGTWVLWEHGEPVAEETWQREDTPEGPVWRSAIRSNFPWPYRTHLTLALTPDLAWRELLIRLEREGEAPVEYRGHPEEAMWLALRRAGTEESHGFYDWEPRMEIDYPSPLFNTLTLKRLALQEGEARELQVYAIDPFTFTTGRILQGYERLADTQVRCRAGTFQGRHYRYVNALTKYVGDIYTDEEDNVLDYKGAWELTEARHGAP